MITVSDDGSVSVKRMLIVVVVTCTAKICEIRPKVIIRQFERKVAIYNLLNNRVLTC
jgi:transcription elongation factor Elf1